MPLPLPKLDDRTFDQLLKDATARLKASTQEWTDLSPSDPGMVLLELFAFLTETMIARMNRLPDKAYIAFLNLLGVSLQPHAAATVELVFTKTAPFARRVVEIPRGTRITTRPTGGGVAPIFITDKATRIGGNENSVTVTAVNAVQVDGELIGVGRGEAGQTVQVGVPPIITPTGDGRDLVVGVEIGADETLERLRELQFDGKTYRQWSEVEYFSNTNEDKYVYKVDRMSGVIQFAPAARLMDESGALPETPSVIGAAAVPPPNRMIRAWYRHGGGVEGNIAANTLTVLKDVIPGVEVTNPEAATGGRSAETLANARLRGPRDLHALERAVTVRDFEEVARKTPGVARAKAITEAEWSYGRRGAVDVLLVPDIDEGQWRDGKLTEDMLLAAQTALALEGAQSAIQERKPVGTISEAMWTRYIKVSVRASIKVRREEDREAVQKRLEEQLYKTICPLPTPGVNTRGWQFGQALRASHIYDVALHEPGVRYVEQVRMVVSNAPESVTSIAADRWQPHTWYACSGATLYRSLDDGDGWEAWHPPADFTEAPQTLWRVLPHPDHAGVVALCTRADDNVTDSVSRVYISRDCGETWQNKIAHFGSVPIHDMAWMTRNKQTSLLIATDVALYELPALRPNPDLIQTVVVPRTPQLGFYAVSAVVDVNGNLNIAVAAKKSGNVGGVYLSSNGGKSFRQLLDDQTRTNLSEEDIRTLEFQQDGPRTFLWAGAYVGSGNDPGKGAWRWEIIGADADDPDGWRNFAKGWTAGSCYALTFPSKDTVVAGTHRGGIMYMDVSKSEPTWKTVAPNESAGLPIRGTGDRPFLPIHSVATDPNGAIIMGGALGLPNGDSSQTLRGQGIYRARTNQTGDYATWKYEKVSTLIYEDRVTLPLHRLFVSGEHILDVTSEDETF
ncbi:MAG: baseplate J/gp47 family protein [Chloroflexota bacterium]|nr:baseplate J/gp47 family protein [Chloroflexota bacterium]